jgi:hypothetical protein
LWLIVLHTPPDEKIEPCLALLANTELPALWRLRADGCGGVTAVGRFE